MTHELEHGAHDGAEHGAEHGAPIAAPVAVHAPVAPSAPCPPLKAGGHGGIAGPRAPMRAIGAAQHRAGHGAGHGAPHGAKNGALAGAPGGAPSTAEALVAELEQAGETLLCLPQGGHTTRLRTSTWRVLHDAAEAYAHEPGARLRPPVPNAAAITRMDTAMAWLALIPDDKFVLRRIVACRMLVSPHTGRHLYPWRRLGTLLGADHKAIQRWHAQGIGLMLRGLHGR